MKSRSVAIALAAVIAFGIILIFYPTEFRHEPVKVLLKPVEGDRLSAPSSYEPSAVDPVTNVASITVAGEPTNIASDFDASTDYRVFFENLLVNKSQAAGLYASHILKECARYRELSFLVPTTSSSQDVARDLISSRCRSFTTDELSDQRRRGLSVDPRLQGGLAELRRAWYKATANEKDQRATLTAVLSSKDPLLMAYVFPGAIYRTGDENLAFDGVPYGKEYRQLIMNISNAAACEATGNACGSMHALVVEACAFGEICAGSVKELVRLQALKYFEPGGARVFDTFYPKILRAIKDGDAASFLP